MNKTCSASMFSQYNTAAKKKVCEREREREREREKMAQPNVPTTHSCAVRSDTTSKDQM